MPSPSSRPRGTAVFARRSSSTGASFSRVSSSPTRPSSSTGWTGSARAWGPRRRTPPGLWPNRRRSSRKTYSPPQSVRSKVTTNDTFDALAARPDITAAGAGCSPPLKVANDLAFFNFRTRNPPEINWYLYNKVGCRRVTHDGKNYMFSSVDQPGVIYLPAGSAATIRPVSQEERLNAWIGIGVKAGTTFAVPGIETVLGWALSLDQVGK